MTRKKQLKKGGTLNNKTQTFIESIKFLVPLDDNYNLMPGSISKKLLQFMDIDMNTMDTENETPLTEYESFILTYFLDKEALHDILDDGSLSGPKSMVANINQKVSVGVGGSRKKRTKKRKSKKRKYSKKKKVQKGGIPGIFRTKKSKAAREALKYMEGKFNVDDFKGTQKGAQGLQANLFGSTQHGAQNFQSKLFGSNKEVIQKQIRTKQVGVITKKVGVITKQLTPDEQQIANQPLPPLPGPKQLPPVPKPLPPPVPEQDYNNSNYTVTNPLSNEGRIYNFMIIDTFKKHFILSLKPITQQESMKVNNNNLEKYINYDKSLHGAHMINNIEGDHLIEGDDLIEKFIYYGEIKGSKILDKFSNISNSFTIDKNQNQNYSYTIRENFTEKYRSLEDIINYYEYEKVHKIPFFTRRIEKLYKKIDTLHNITHITINDLSLRDVYILKDDTEITNGESEDIKIITRGRSIQRLATAQPQINKINDLFKVINYTSSDTYCEISYKNLLRNIKLLDSQPGDDTIIVAFNTLKERKHEGEKICNEKTKEVINQLNNNTGNFEGIQDLNANAPNYEQEYAKYKKYLYLTHLKKMKENET